MANAFAAASAACWSALRSDVHGELFARGSPMTHVDLLRWPLIGPLLRWRHARTSLQLVLLLAAIVVVLHGLFGQQVASDNLSTVLVWVHYRGLLVVALLAAGNFFCAGCPFVRVRDWGRRAHAPSRHWPAVLRGKGISIALFVAVLFCYELFDLWALPRATGYLVLTYFAAALVIDLVFKGATFCKHICPIGQFTFIASVMSPLELRVRSQATCTSCRTSDCIRGRYSPEEPRQMVQRGCELGLYLPAKIGNIDCTFCLDCVQACPHDNVALTTRLPALELVDPRRRSGIGRLVDRPDLAILSILFVFGAMMNALGMIAPVRFMERWLASVIGSTSEFLVLGAMFVLILLAVPCVLLGTTAAIGRWFVGDTTESIRTVVKRYAFGLVPLGVGMWAAHYGFHLLTGLIVVVPVTQSAVIDMMGWPALGEPMWGWAGMRPGNVLPIQLGLVLLGTLGSLAVMSLISQRDHPDRAARATAPWAITTCALTAAAIWILFQPMDMRGLGFGG
ncbi:MAG: FesM [Acidobacteria bacterium]|nr:FesM [Acidobacteriota bacterium]